MKAELCPECGSAKVEVETLGVIMGTDGRAKATCDSCGWAGLGKDLIQAEVPEKGMTQDAAHAIALEVAGAYQVLLSQLAAQPIGLAMLQSGMVGVRDGKVLARLIKAATIGAHRATLDEIEKMQEEAQNGAN